MKPRQPPARERCQFHQAPTISLGDVDRRFHRTSDHRPRRRFFAYAARVSYAARNVRRRTRLTRGTCASGASARSRSPTPRASRSIPPSFGAGSRPGPHSLWRYGDFLPVSTPPKGTLPAGWTPLLRADRLAEALGLREVWIKNDAANPTHSFKDRVVSIALARARELGFQTIACASTGNLANAVAAHAAAAGLESYVFIPVRPRGAEGARDRRLRHEPGRRARQLR